MSRTPTRSQIGAAYDLLAVERIVNSAAWTLRNRGQQPPRHWDDHPDGRPADALDEAAAGARRSSKAGRLVFGLGAGEVVGSGLGMVAASRSADPAWRAHMERYCAVFATVGVSGMFGGLSLMSKGSRLSKEIDALVTRQDRQAGNLLRRWGGPALGNMHQASGDELRRIGDRAHEEVGRCTDKVARLAQVPPGEIPVHTIAMDWALAHARLVRTQGTDRGLT
jgi:hypothetical protein